MKPKVKMSYKTKPVLGIYRYPERMTVITAVQPHSLWTLKGKGISQNPGKHEEKLGRCNSHSLCLFFYL